MGMKAYSKYCRKIRNPCLRTLKALLLSVRFVEGAAIDDMRSLQGMPRSLRTSSSLGL